MSEAEITEELDVRPLLERGEEPFSLIMAAVARMPQEGALRLRTTFEPVPLFEVLARRGLTHASRRLSVDDWETDIRRGHSADLATPPCARAAYEPQRPAAPETDSTSIIHINVSDLVPPEPMVRILEAAAGLESGQTLLVEHHRRPVYLYPQLDSQGFVHETNELGPGRVQIAIRRA
jgi:uncharacterized protein (DUF2249 family)